MTALTRREALASFGGLLAAGAVAGCGRTRKAAVPATPEGAALSRPLPLRVCTVFEDPGRPPLATAYRNPRHLAALGFNCQMVADWRGPNAAITYGRLGADAPFAPGSQALGWVEALARQIERRTAEIKAAGLKALYHTDMVVLPIPLYSRFRSDLVDRQGRLSLRRPLTRELIRIALGELFERFPLLDGLVIRTGEVYLQALPYHTGEDPITEGPASHLELLSILREEACVKRGKLILYRTWAFDGFTTSPGYYLRVSEGIPPHPLLAFAIKHTNGDFWRTVPFNKTLGLGRHPQVVEVECAREYEGKGAHPNYIARGVIEGFPELRPEGGLHGLGELAARPQLHGVLSWARGGGWNGPSLPDELWCALNTNVLLWWTRAEGDERALFLRFAAALGLSGEALAAFRRVALLSEEGVLHGHYTTPYRLQALAWMRDEYIGGSDRELAADFARIIALGLVEAVVAEKRRAVALWQEVDQLGQRLHLPNREQERFIRTSCRYGNLLFGAVCHGFTAMLYGRLAGEGKPTREAFHRALLAFRAAWSAYLRLPRTAPLCPTLYLPFSFVPPASARSLPSVDQAHGLRPSLAAYARRLGYPELARLAA